MDYDKEIDEVPKVSHDPEHPDNVETVPLDLTLEEEPTTDPTPEELQSVSSEDPDPASVEDVTQEWNL